MAIHPPVSGTARTRPTPADSAEREASSKAEEVMRAPRPRSLQASSPVGSRPGGMAPAAAPPIVHDALRAPGKPLETEARSFMESRFGRDFSRVRVHSDERAARSADAMQARAYTVGNDIVFGPGEYAPGRARGRQLMAHELTHVVQQQDALPVLQRDAKTAKSSFGKFVADPYDAQIETLGDIKVGYSADVTITLEANDKVDAAKIAFIQTALGSKDGKNIPGGYKNDKEQKIQEGRMTQGGKEAGTHIDQWADVRTPLAGMKDATGDNLASPTPNKKYAEIGWHFYDSGKNLQNHNAWMHDEPQVTSGDRFTPVDDVYSELSQRFESAAIAIDGKQAGTYLGSVEWGWEKHKKDQNPRMLDFKIKSGGNPSSTFMEAAKLWNDSKMSDGSAPISVPIPSNAPAKTDKKQ